MHLLGLGIKLTSTVAFSVSCIRLQDAFLSQTQDVNHGLVIDFMRISFCLLSFIEFICPLVINTTFSSKILYARQNTAYVTITNLSKPLIVISAYGPPKMPEFSPSNSSILVSWITHCINLYYFYTNVRGCTSSTHDLFMKHILSNPQTTRLSGFYNL